MNRIVARFSSTFIASILVLCSASLAGARVSPSGDRSLSNTSTSTRGVVRRNEGVDPVSEVRNLNTFIDYPTIAAALAAPTTLDGHTLEVEVPNHNEGLVTVNKSVTIQGPVGGAVVHATTNTGASDDARGWFLVTAPNVTFRRLTFDGETPTVVVYQAIRFRADGGLVQNCAFRDIAGDPGSYDGRGVAFFEADGAVDACTFTNIARVGIHMFGPGYMLVTGCTYTGKGAGDWLDYGVEVEGGGHAQLIQNTITNCTGVATVDGSTSAGVLATEFFEPHGTFAGFNSNFITGNTDGIAVGYQSPDSTIAEARENDLSGNSATAITSVSSNTVEASGNWWGAIDVSTVAGETSGSVDFTPWLHVGTDTNPGVPGFQGDFSTVHVDDDSPQVGTVGRVQEGVDMVTASTVLIGPGTYVEQVNIAEECTLTGAGVGITIIQSPASLSNSYLTPGPTYNFPIILAQDSDDIRIQNLTVDGNGQGNANYRFEGIGYFNASGLISNVEIKRIRETPFSGTQQGTGIGAFNNTGGPFSLEVANVTLTDFQKNGMRLAGDGLTVDVHDCTVTGAGYTALIAQNGIQVSSGAGGAIARCTISNIGYSPQDAVACGVLAFGAGSNVNLSELNGAHAITNVQQPVYYFNAGGSMDGIQTSGGSDFGPIYVQNSTSSVPNAANAAPRRAVAALDASIRTTTKDVARRPRILTAFAVTITNSCLEGVDADSTIGIGVETAGGGLTVNAHDNHITDWERGVATYGGPTLTVNQNSIVSNTLAGYDNTGGPPQNAENNWWGSPSGPSGDGPGTGDAVLGGNVDFTPFLTSPTALPPSCPPLPITPTTTTLTSDVNPSQCQQTVNLIATVSPNGATGMVNFYDNGALLGSSPVTGGTATLSVPNFAGGHHPLTATYGGDGVYGASGSGVYVQNVHCTPGTTTTVFVTPCDTLGWSRDNIRDGGTVDITSTYPHASGSLEFNTTNSNSKADFIRSNVNADLLSTLTALAVDLYRNSSSTAAVHFAPAVRLSIDNGQAVNRFSTLIWEPVYNGIPVFPTDDWNTYDLFKGNFWQRAFRTTGAKTIDVYNRTISDWLQPGFVVDGDNDTSVVVGPNARVLEYEIGVGSGWANAFHGAADDFRIGFAGTDSVFDFETLVTTSTVLSTSPNPSSCGGKVTLTAQVTIGAVPGLAASLESAGASGTRRITPAAVTGEVNFFSGGSPIGSTVLVNGTATLSVPDFPPGMHSLTATYKGNACYLPSNSNKVVQEVRLAPTTTALDVNPPKTNHGEKVTLTATVSPSDATGSVDFFDGPVSPPKSLFKADPTATFTASPQVTLGMRFTSDVPAYVTSIRYYKDASNTGSVRVELWTATGTLLRSQSYTPPPGAGWQDVPLVPPVPIAANVDYITAYNTSTGFSYALNYFDGGPIDNPPMHAPQNTPTRPNGVYNFGSPGIFPTNNYFGASYFVDAAISTGTLLGTSTLVGGVATLSVTDKAIGFHSLSAVYRGGGCYEGSASSKTPQEVNPLPTTTTLSSDNNPSMCGEKVTFRALVNPTAASGEVNFYDGVTAIGSSPLVTGVATLSISTLTRDNHSITAVYKGDTLYASSTSNKIEQMVNKIPTTTTLARDTSKVKQGHKVTLTATISPSVATGTVDLLEGVATVQTVQSVGGVATFSLDTLPVGQHLLKAAYNGDSCYANSFSDTVRVTVSPDSCPYVEVVAPNGGEVLTVGTDTKLRWIARDDNEVMYVDLLLSRTGSDGTYETIATMQPNDSSYVWHVSGPGTNTGATNHFTAFLKVIATDNAGQACEDTSDAGFAIFDLSTATDLALFQAGPADVGVELRWRFAATVRPAEVSVERAERLEGPWASVPAALREESGVSVAVDRTAQTGRTYFYRLVVTLTGGERATYGPLSVTAGTAPTELALSRPAPNPSAGPTRVDFTIPRECRVRLGILDLMGREVAVIAEGAYRPGRYQASWDGLGPRGQVPVGLYFMRLQAGGKTLVQRITVAR